MPTASSLLAVLVTLGLATSSTALTTAPATSALLIEGIFAGKALRIVVDEESAKAEVTFAGKRHFFDLDGDKAHRIEADGSLVPADLAAGEAAPRPDIQAWGPGPSVAGHPSVYHVMYVDEEICGELLISPWMKPFVDPAIEALTLLERIKGERDIRQTGMEGVCADLPLSSYALAGWPLMAGSIDRPIFRTDVIEFDYQPSGDELIGGAAH